MLELYASANGILSIIVLILAISQIVIGSWPRVKKADHSGALAKDNIQTPLVPFGPFFAIWLVIFAWVLAFAIWQIRAENLVDERLITLRLPMILIMLCTCLWQAYVPKFGMGPPSLIALTTAAGTAIYTVLPASAVVLDLYSLNYWFGLGMIQFLTGWLCITVFVNLASTLLKIGARFDPRKTQNAILLITLATIIVAVVANITHSYLVAVSAIWGLLGVFVNVLVNRYASEIAVSAAWDRCNVSSNASWCVVADLTMNLGLIELDIMDFAHFLLRIYDIDL